MKIESKSEKVLSPLKIYFKYGLCGVVPCAINAKRCITNEIVPKKSTRYYALKN